MREFIVNNNLGFLILILVPSGVIIGLLILLEKLIRSRKARLK